MNLFSRATFAAHPRSLLDLEVLAERYLERMYPQNLEVPTRLDVIGMMDKLEDHFGIIFGVSETELDNGEEGHTDPFKKQILVATHVYEGLKLGDGRARQTACHEVGHIQHIRQIRKILRDGRPQLARQVNVVVPVYQDPEWQAHRVGSALLMPRTTVPAIYRQGGIAAVTDFFQVSISNAQSRIKVLQRLNVL